MNIRAERIEQTLQIINRNLLLIYSSQFLDVTPLDFRSLQKVDTKIFGHDKFAFEMIYFIKSIQNMSSGNAESLAEIWEKHFAVGLEALLVECALVKDDIERDCFVSRIYCWFTEKTAERRDLPRNSLQHNFDSLKNSLQTLGISTTSTVKALDLLASKPPASNSDETPGRDLLAGNIAERDNSIEMELAAAEHKLPSLKMKNKTAYGNVIMPDVFRKRPDYGGSFLPNISDGNDNYGMIFNKPESEAEKNMHELWLARRRQEAFEWKTKQHMALVMDRLSLQKSRLESDNLRKYEANLVIENAQLRLADDKLAPLDRNSPNKYAPMSSSNRPRSGNKQSASRNAIGNVTHAWRENNDGDASVYSNDSSPERLSQTRTRAELDITGVQQTTITLNNNGIEEEVKVTKPGRVVVTKEPKKKEIKPMHFKTHVPDNFNKKEHYMELSDSDDEDKPDRQIKAEVKRSGTAGGGGGKKGDKGGGAGDKAVVKALVQFKHDVPIVRERPQSAKQFRKVSTDDAELKVHYRHTNFRRMPLTEEQETWIQERETERKKGSEEFANKLAAEFAEKGDKGGKKDKKEGGDKEKKDKDKKDKKDKKKEEPVVEAKPVCKWKSAQHYMDTNFPDFEDENECPEAQGPMRQVQLIECARVMGAFAEFKCEISEEKVRRALLIPQDRPEAICLENLREPNEGVMQNPNPPEYWRKCNIAGGGKKKKKGGKKKKK